MRSNNNRHTIQRALLPALAGLLIALAPSLTFSASAQDDCGLVKNASASGLSAANQRISDVEQAVKNQVSQVRGCMDRFGDLAGRETVTMVGVDLTPIRNAMFQQGCNVIQTQTSQVQSQVNSATGQVSSAVGQAVGTNLGNAADQVARQTYSSAQPASSGGFFDTVACKIFGKC